MHGSGTSILAEVLDASALFRGVDADHWENSFFREQVAERVLACAERYLEVGYEPFCRDPVRVAPGIFDFVGIAFGPEAQRLGAERVHDRSIGAAGRGALAGRLRARVRGGR